MTTPPLHIGLVLYPGLTQLDLTGPYEVFARIPGAQLDTVAHTLAPVRADSGLALVPSTTLATCPPLDVLFVPGGYGQIAQMTDPAMLAFLRHHGERARWVTSVCTGALLLGAAGLLRGYRAATHWMYMDLLPSYGATPVAERVVVDRNRVTAGGVTAGIDFGLQIIAEVAGPAAAQAAQLELEYDPHPPFDCGHPRVASPALVDAVRARFAARMAERLAQRPLPV
ncbi:MAG: DJ-1/PfpI family protein [Kofleriaceae bacterium]